MRSRRRELRWTIGAALFVVGLLLLPFEVFDVVAVAGAVWLLWWMWTAPRAALRHGAGIFPFSPVVFGTGAVLAAVFLGRMLGRPGFAMATLLLGCAVAIGFIRAVTPVREVPR